VQKGKSERTKVYLILVLGLVLCVVSYFRFFHKGSTVGTDAVSPTTLATVPSIATPVGVHPQQTDAQELQRQEFAGGVVRDIFEPGKSVVIADARLKALDNTRPRETALVLSGLVYSANNPIAIINGQFLRSGDQVGGYKIVRIGPKEVVMQGEDREIVLRVANYGQK
jgi:hypothetical protein